MKKVVKFGGSSLANAEQFRKVGDIIHADPSRVYVIPSAPGKRFDGDIKVTDMLIDIFEKAEQGKSFKKELKEVKKRYDEIIKGLGLDLKLDEEFKTIKSTLEEKPTLEDFLRGLRCSGCRHNCSLLSPRCMNGARKASQAESQYNEMYNM